MMKRKLVLWLILTFLTLRVASSNIFDNQGINDPSESPLNKQLINDQIELSLNQNDNGQTYVSYLNPHECNQMKDEEVRLVAPKESTFQKKRRYQRWMLQSQLKLSDNITQLILSYLNFFPKTTKLNHQKKGLWAFAAISPDGRWLLSKTCKRNYFNFNVMPQDDCNLHLTDLATGETVRTFTAPTRELFSCAITDNHSFVVGGGGTDIYIWNTSSEKLQTTLLGHTNKIRTCSIFRHDTRIASGSDDFTVRVWQIDDLQWRSLYVLIGHTDAIMSISTSTDHPWITSFARDTTLRIWNTDTNECIRIIFTGHTQYPGENSCVMSLKHRRIGSIGRYGETKLWDIDTGDCTQTPYIYLEQFYTPDFHMVYLSETRFVWWRSHIDGIMAKAVVGVRNTETNKDEYTYYPTLCGDHFEKIELVSVSADGKYLIIVLNKYNQFPIVKVVDFEIIIPQQHAAISAWAKVVAKVVPAIMLILFACLVVYLFG